MKTTIYIPIEVSIDKDAPSYYGKSINEILDDIKKDLANMVFSSSSGYYRYEKKRIHVSKLKTK